MKTLIVKLLCLLILVVNVGCPKYDPDQELWDSTIIIKNKSNGVILRFFDFYNYPDTILRTSSPYLNDRQKEMATIIENSELKQDEAWIKYFNDSETTKLMLYIFDSETIENQPWDTIKEYNMILKRYDLTLKDLEENNWIINYP